MTDLRFETRNYLVRTIQRTDISERWCSWLTDPGAAHLLNAPCRRLSPRELEDYIGKFDGVDRMIFGIFHAATGTHIGIMTAIASRGGQDVLLNIMVGEDEFRSIGGVTELREIRTAVSNYLFFPRGFRSMFASVVAHNKRMIAYLQLTGWEVVNRVTSKPSPTGETVDLVLFRLTRESYIRKEGKSWASVERSGAVPESA